MSSRLECLPALETLATTCGGIKPGDRCLIVSQRGGRVDEPPLSWLAREIARGRARVVTAQVEQPVDTALRGVLQKLRASAEGTT